MREVVARDCVRVNARHNVSAECRTACNISAMDDRWFQRLIDAIDADCRSHNQLSEDAGLGRNYIQQMVKYGKQPTGPKLEAILNALGGGKLAVYVMTGLDITDEDLDTLRLLQEADDEIRSNVIAILRASKRG